MVGLGGGWRDGPFGPLPTTPPPQPLSLWGWGAWTSGACKRLIFWDMQPDEPRKCVLGSSPSDSRLIRFIFSAHPVAVLGSSGSASPFGACAAGSEPASMASAAASGRTSHPTSPVLRSIACRSTTRSPGRSRQAASISARVRFLRSRSPRPNASRRRSSKVRTGYTSRFRLHTYRPPARGAGTRVTPGIQATDGAASAARHRADDFTDSRSICGRSTTGPDAEPGGNATESTITSSRAGSFGMYRNAMGHQRPFPS